MRARIGDGVRDHQLMPRYQMEFEGRLRLSRIREIANDSRPARSPILLADGTRMCGAIYSKPPARKRWKRDGTRTRIG